MYSITATLGRNFSQTVNPLPLPDMMSISTWEQFVEDVEHDMAATVRGAQPTLMMVEQHRGKGEWNGQEEESCKVTILADFAEYPTDVISTIKGHLASLAQQYSQDAIALTVGVSELVSPFTPRDRLEERVTAPEKPLPKSPCYCDSAYHPAGH